MITFSISNTDIELLISGPEENCSCVALFDLRQKRAKIVIHQMAVLFFFTIFMLGLRTPSGLGFTSILFDKQSVDKTSIQIKLKVVVGVCNYVIFLANIFLYRPIIVCRDGIVSTKRSFSRICVWKEGGAKIQMLMV